VTALSFGPRLRDGNGDFFHLEKWRRFDSKGTWTGIHWKFARTEENSGGSCSNSSSVREFCAQDSNGHSRIDFGCNS